MPTIRAKDRLHQFARSVRHGRLTGEFPCALHENPKSDDFSDSIQSLRRLGGEHRKSVQGALTGGIDRQILAYLVRYTSAGKQRALGKRNLAADIHQVAHSLGRNIRSDRIRGFWKLIPE